VQRRTRRSAFWSSSTFAVWRSHLHRAGSSIFGKGIDYCLAAPNRRWAERVRPNSQLRLSHSTATSYFAFASSSPQPAFRAEPIGRALSGPSHHALKNKPVSRRATRWKARFVQRPTHRRPIGTQRAAERFRNGRRPANSLPLCGPVTGQPQVTVLRITIPSHTALHLAGKRSNKPNDPFSKK
jgi:hypothetical protein